MRRTLFRSMALTNIRNNRKFYLPYILTIIMTVAMFFNMCSISRNPQYEEFATVKEILGFGVVIIGIFSVIFLFYTNSFLMKRRKKELGLYHILGLEKRHISRILIWETLIVAAGGLTAGILFGQLFDRLMFLVLLKVFQLKVSVSYEMQPYALKMTLAVFAAIFALILIYNIVQIGRASAVELLKKCRGKRAESKMVSGACRHDVDRLWLLYCCYNGQYYGSAGEFSDRGFGGCDRYLSFVFGGQYHDSEIIEKEKTFLL